MTADGPAAKAGIEAGDVVVKFDGKRRHLDARAAARRGADADRQDGRRRSRCARASGADLKVAVGRLIEEDDKDEDQDKPQKPAGDGSAPTGQAASASSLAPLDDELRNKHGIDKKVKGVVVTEVDPQSPAAQTRRQARRRDRRGRRRTR